MDRTQIEYIYKQTPLQERKKLGRAKVVRRHFEQESRRLEAEARALVQPLEGLMSKLPELESELEAAKTAVQEDDRTDKERALSLNMEVNRSKDRLYHTEQQIEKMKDSIDSLDRASTRAAAEASSVNPFTCCSAKIVNRRSA